MVALLTKSLAVICPSCDFLNVVGAVRCMACGTATDGVAMHTAQTREQPKHPTPDTTPQAGTPGQSEATVRGVHVDSIAEPPAPPRGPAAPPGLRPSGAKTLPPTAPPKTGEALGVVPSSPSGSFNKGPPPRPTFQSSTVQPAAATGPKFGLAVLAGPARGQKFRLAASGAQIGRSRGLILFPDDPFVSPLHATLSIRDGRLFIKDESSTSGVYVSVTQQETIGALGYFSAGMRLFRFAGMVEPAPPWNKVDVLVYGAPLPNNQPHYVIEEILLGDRPGRTITTPGPVVTIGQGRCDFSFPQDEGLAPRHCEISPMASGAMIRDVSGGLGTFVRSAGDRALKAGDRIRIGQQTLQVEAIN
jgi:pSer/pThr/pTyr-binding forkhead associated (FHA) protein